MEECIRLCSQTFGVNHHLALSSSDALSEWKMEELDIGIFASENAETTGLQKDRNEYKSSQ